MRPCSRTGSARVSHERIPDATHGLDVSRSLGVALDLGAELRDVDVDRAIERFVLLALESVEDLLARQDPAGRSGQDGQQLELVVRQDDPLAVDDDFARVEVDLELTRAEARPSGRG